MINKLNYFEWCKNLDIIPSIKTFIIFYRLSGNGNIIKEFDDTEPSFVKVLRGNNI